MRLVWSAVIALGLAGVAIANDDEAKPASTRLYTEAEVEAMLDLAKRVSKLEDAQQDAEMEKLRKMAEKEKQEETQGLPARISKLEKQVAEQKPVYDASKMLSFATPDGNFTAKIGGRFYTTYRHLFDAGSATSAGKDQFAVDSARFQLDGTFYKDFYYRIEGEAKTGENANGAPAAPAAFRTKDAYMGWQGLGDWLQVQAGQFKCTISQEETTSSRFIDFAERSVLNRIVPGHVQGVRLSGSLSEKMFEWYFGVMNGAIARDSDRGFVDVNDEKDLFGRLFISPFKNMDGILKGIRVGVDGSRGKRDDQGAAAPLVPAVSSGDWGLPNLLTGGVAGVTIEGIQTRENLNFSWVYGPASLRAEYARVRNELGGVNNLNGAFHQTAWYVQATYLLTGEEKPLENRVKPISNFSPLDGGWGAWELAVRWGVIDAHDAVPAGVYGVPGSAGANSANHHTEEFTFGVNWWMTPNVRMMFNYERLMYDVDVPTGKNGRGKPFEDEIYIRWQIDF